MKCKFCSKETSNEYEVCDECEKTLTVAINKNRRKMVKTKIANQKRGITSLVCAIIALTHPFGLVTAFACGIVAIIFGRAAKNTAGEQIGKVGQTLGVVSIVATIITFFYKLFLIAAGVAVTVLAILCFIALHQMGWF